MTETVLTADRILEAAEQVLRRFGPAKTTVVDVARALDVSHGSIYRHFPSKAALRDAVAKRWLHRVSTPLQAIAAQQGPAPERLKKWFDELIAIKHRKVLDDPELFATYHRIAEQAGDVVDAHVDELVSQLTQIIEDGIREGSFAVADPRVAAAAVFQATLRFHHPIHAGEWLKPGIDEDFAALWLLLMSGLMKRA